MPTPSAPDGAPILSVVIPVYNEVRTIDRILAAIHAVGLDSEIIIVDDCSTDGTRDRLKELAASDNRLRVFYHDVNQGKGAALRTGFAQATGNYVIVQDADLEYDPSEFPRLLEPALSGNADVVFGSRFCSGEHHRVRHFWHSFGNKLLTRISNLVTKLNLTDMETCYKLFRRDIIQNIAIEENRFGFEPEITAKLARYHLNGQPLRICEVGISYHGRTYREGKKIGWKDGVRALWCIVKYNWI
jgi:glycosyltransferase involved in cell wall biosynthesis